MFQFKFEIIPIHISKSIMMGSTVLLPPGQSIFPIPTNRQFHFIMIEIYVYKLKTPIYCKTLCLHFCRITTE